MDGPVLAVGRTAGAKVTPMSMGALQQMVEQNDEKSEEGHRRLRSDLEKLDLRTSAIAAAQAEMRLAIIKAATPDVQNLRMNPSTVIAIVIAALTAYMAFQDLKRGNEMNRVLLESLAKTVIAQGAKP